MVLRRRIDFWYTTQVIRPQMIPKTAALAVAAARLPEPIQMPTRQQQRAVSQAIRDTMAIDMAAAQIIGVAMTTRNAVPSSPLPMKARQQLMVGAIAIG